MEFVASSQTESAQSCSGGAVLLIAHESELKLVKLEGPTL